MHFSFERRKNITIVNVIYNSDRLVESVSTHHFLAAYLFHIFVYVLEFPLANKC